MQFSEPDADGNWVLYADAQDAIAAAVAAERERCAKLCESLGDSFSDSRRDASEFASLIRKES